MYEVDKLIDEVESALHKMDECGLEAWSSDRIGVEILPCHKNFLTGGEYVLHVFFFTSETDVYGCHVFDTSREKYYYSNYKERMQSTYEEEAADWYTVYVAPGIPTIEEENND